MQVQFLGHSALALHHEGHTVLVDPFLSGNPALQGRAIPAMKPTTILLTHAHADHLGDTETLSKQHRAPVIATYELGVWLEKRGCPAIPANMGGRIQQPWGWVRLVPAFHSSSFEGEYLGMPCGVVFEAGGITFYHAGDTCVFSDMALIAELNRPQVAFLPIGGHFTMDLQEALKAVELIRPDVVVPIHYDTFPPIRTDAEEFRRQVEAHTFTRVRIMKALDTWEVELPARQA